MMWHIANAVLKTTNDALLTNKVTAHSVRKSMTCHIQQLDFMEVLEKFPDKIVENPVSTPVKVKREIEKLIESNIETPPSKNL